MVLYVLLIRVDAYYRDTLTTVILTKVRVLTHVAGNMTLFLHKKMQKAIGYPKALLYRWPILVPLVAVAQKDIP